MELFQKIMNFRTQKIEYYYAFVLIGVYGVWKVIKTYLGPNVETLDKFGTFFNESLAALYVKFASLLLSLLAIDHTTFITETSYGNFITIAISGAAGIYVAYHCLGVTASIVFAVVTFLLPGSLKRKLIFTIGGLLVMFFANLTRIITLVFLDKYTSKFWVDLNHSLIFVVMFYGILFLCHFLFLKPILFKK